MQAFKTTRVQSNKPQGNNATFILLPAGVRRIYRLLHIPASFWDTDYYHGVGTMQADPGQLR